jgi:hypothetical protein
VAQLRHRARHRVVLVHGAVGGAFRKIALQFPDSLLPDASAVQQELKVRRILVDLARSWLTHLCVP